MAKTLFDFDYHVLPGDVLLLRSAGLKAVANRFGQRLMRPLRPLKAAAFTHVALVVTPASIADAIPETGVRIRQWADAADHYELEHCRVARHPALLSLARDPTRLLARVQYYYAQRYALWSLIRDEVQDDAGVVCSQFVSLVLHELGLPALVPTAMHALPSDIDHRTRGLNGWRQFPFVHYGWSPAASRPPLGDPYWQVLEDSLNAQGLPDFFEAPQDSGAHGEAVESSETLEHEAEVPPPTGDPGIRLSQAIGELLASSMGDAEALLRVSAQLDRLVLASSEALGRQRQAVREGAAAEVFSGVPGLALESSLSGQELLDQWQAFYIDPASSAAITLSQADAGQRLVRHRALLRDNVAELTRLARQRNEAVQAFQAQFDQVTAWILDEKPVSQALIAQLHQQAQLLLSHMAWLEADSGPEILARTASYPGLVSGPLMAATPRLTADAARQGLEQILALMALDEQRFKWVDEFKPQLLRQVGMLAGALRDGSEPEV